METLPYLLFGPYAGVLADRVDRRRIMLLSDVACALALLAYGAYALLDATPEVWTLLAAPFVFSTVRCFFMPAKTAAIPRLVPDTLLLRANALSAATFNIMFVLGLAVSAGVVAQLYAISPQFFFVALLVMNGISFLGSAVYIARLPQILPNRVEAHDVHPIADFREGLRFISKRHDLKVLIALMTAFRLGVAPFFVVYVAANDLWYGGLPATIMWFELAFFFGMIGGSAWIAKLTVHRPMRFFMLGLAAVGLSVALMAFCRDFLWGFLLLNLVAGIIVPLADIPTATYLMTSVQDAFRGRVNSVREMIATGIMPIGMLLAGGMIRQWGLVTAFLVMGVVMMGACLAAMLDREFRNVRMPEPESQPENLVRADAVA
jgi:DHA3 family macrolide efflux protein-like MFS transporter